MLIPFERITEQNRTLGGKAWGLGQLCQKGFPIPPGLVLDSEPTESEWTEILAWWRQLNFTPLAVRSSADAEDSAETSFAGQNRTFLNVSNEKALKDAIRDCFASHRNKNSQAYRQFFATTENGRMNVILQKMVAPRFAGVFFSENPVSPGQGWVLELIPGLGEDLVSGQVTPGRVRQSGRSTDIPPGFTERDIAEVVKMGTGVREFLGFPVDMEWAIDGDGKVSVLQARPITTGLDVNKINYCKRELDRLRQERSPSTTWDGQTFAEWSGLPSRLTFSIWRRAFTPHHSFGTALSKLGYRSFSNHNWQANDSLLERVFGRAYINLERLSDLYYGEAPYTIQMRPRPHTKFDSSKLGLRSLLNFPAGSWNMVKVAWNLSTQRQFYYQQCLQELSLFKHHFTRPQGSVPSTLSREDLLDQITGEVEEFSMRSLHWPLVLVILTESTLQNLRQLTMSVVGEIEAERRIREWMGKGIHTVTFEMQKSFAEACACPTKQDTFMARYGHRGPGEMDLARPRWSELGERAFIRGTSATAWSGHSADVEAEISALPSFKRELILEEWRMLKKLLETREAWKMELLKPYAWLRTLIGEMGRRLDLGADIHWLELEEILESPKWNQNQAPETVLKLIADRKEEEKEFRKYSLPDQLSLSSLSEVINEDNLYPERQLEGDPLSPGIAFGQVRIVTDPNLENLSEWPDNVILAADCTDPGWTPLFARAKGIVVERGGLLSHCAILSREMGLPAVSGILGLKQKLGNGDQIWVDGNQGRIIYDKK